MFWGLANLVLYLGFFYAIARYPFSFFFKLMVLSEVIGIMVGFFRSND